MRLSERRLSAPGLYTLERQLRLLESWPHTSRLLAMSVSLEHVGPLPDSDIAVATAEILRHVDDQRAGPNRELLGALTAAVLGTEHPDLRRTAADHWCRRLLHDLTEVDPRVREVLLHLRTWFRQRKQTRLANLAMVAGLSSFHLSRLIPQQTGARFTAHLRYLRVSEAALLLDAQVMTVREAARSVGYRYEGDLCNDFVRVVGAPPRRYCEAENSRPADLRTSLVVPTTN